MKEKEIKIYLEETLRGAGIDSLFLMDDISFKRYIDLIYAENKTKVDLYLAEELDGNKCRSELNINLNLFRITAIALFEYTIFWFMFLFLKIRSGRINRAGEDSYLVFNSATNVDRIKGLPKIFDSGKKYKMIYLYNNRILRAFKHYLSNETPKENKAFVGPAAIDFKTIKAAARYRKTGARLERIICSGGGSSSLSDLLHQKLIIQIIHQTWAEKTFRRLKLKGAKPVCLFDLDNSGKEIMLVQELKRNGIPTVLVQHGILTNPYLYLPVSRYMLCCSEREKEELIKCGVKPERLYTLGAPFQTIKRDVRLQAKEMKYSVVVLAGNGSRELQMQYVDMIKNSAVLNRQTRKKLRLHPHFTEEYISLWKNGLPDYAVEEASLLEDLYSSELIITFSQDALINCLRIKKKTVLCLSPGYEENPFYSFLPGIKFLNIASSSAELDKEITFLSGKSAEEYASYIDDDEMRRNFGEDNIEKIKNNFNYFINSIGE
jgi:hypothetical protein